METSLDVQGKKRPSTLKSMGPVLLIWKANMAGTKGVHRIEDVASIKALGFVVVLEGR
jgi:hypothetical protein